MTSEELSSRVHRKPFRPVVIRMVDVLLLLAFQGFALGGISAPNSHAVLSRDGKRVLVMVSPHPEYDYAQEYVLPDGQVASIHELFDKSGVYDALTLEPIWQVEWFSLERDLRWSDDFRYVVRRNRKGMRADWALAFYDQGKLVQEYNCASLLTGLKGTWCMPYETWDWHFRWYDDFRTSADGGRMLLSTARRRFYLAGWEIDLGWQEFYTFDMATGAVFERRVVGVWRVWAYGAAGVVLPIGAMWAIRAGWRKWKASRRRRGFAVVVR